MDSRTPSFGVNDNWVLSHSLLDVIFEPRAEGGSHGLNREGSAASSAAGGVDAKKACAWAAPGTVTVDQRNW